MLTLNPFRNRIYSLDFHNNLLKKHVIVSMRFLATFLFPLLHATLFKENRSMFILICVLIIVCLAIGGEVEWYISPNIHMTGARNFYPMWYGLRCTHVHISQVKKKTFYRSHSFIWFKWRNFEGKMEARYCAVGKHPRIVLLARPPGFSISVNVCERYTMAEQFKWIIQFITLWYDYCVVLFN